MNPPKHPNYPDHTKAYRLMIKISPLYSYGHDTVIMCRLPSDEKYIKHQYKDLGFNVSEVDGAHSAGYCHLCFLCEDDAKRFAEKYINYDSRHNVVGLITSAGMEDLVRIDQNDDIPCYTQANDIRDDRVMPIIARRKALPIRASNVDPGTDKLRKRIEADKKNKSGASEFKETIDKYFVPGYTLTEQGSIEGLIKPDLIKTPAGMHVVGFSALFVSNGKLAMDVSVEYYEPDLLYYDYDQLTEIFDRFEEGTESKYPAFSFAVSVPIINLNTQKLDSPNLNHSILIYSTRSTVGAKTPEKLGRLIELYADAVSRKLQEIKQAGDRLAELEEL